MKCPECGKEINLFKMIGREMGKMEEKYILNSLYSSGKLISGPQYYLSTLEKEKTT